jgi:zinc transport system ATP-binding protein
MNDPLTVANGALVVASDIGVTIDDRLILDNVSMTVTNGEIVTLIGPNGSGKTTLIRILLGLLTPSQGVVTQKPNLHIGYVPQRLHMEPSLPLTVGRFLKFGVPRGPNRQKGRRDAVLAEVGMEKMYDASIHGLSGGELQRVMLARALLRSPELLVLDEPLQGVDITGQNEIYDLITRIRDTRQCGIVMVSHDLHIVMAATDRVICLNHHVCCEGKPETVARDPAFETMFGKQAAARLAIYQHNHDHTHDAHGHTVPNEKTISDQSVQQSETNHVG